MIIERDQIYRIVMSMLLAKYMFHMTGNQIIKFVISHKIRNFLLICLFHNLVVDFSLFKNLLINFLLITDRSLYNLCMSNSFKRTISRSIEHTKFMNNFEWFFFWHIFVNLLSFAKYGGGIAFLKDFFSFLLSLFCFHIT